MAICPLIVHFTTSRARSMHDVACQLNFVRSKDEQKQLVRTSFIRNFTLNIVSDNSTSGLYKRLKCPKRFQFIKENVTSQHNQIYLLSASIVQSHRFVCLKWDSYICINETCHQIQLNVFSLFHFNVLSATMFILFVSQLFAKTMLY